MSYSGATKRYSVFLEGTLVGGDRTEIITFDFDLRTLIPESCRGKHFMVYSSFDTDNFGTDTRAGLRISLNFPQAYNKSFPSLGFVVLGIAEPVFDNTTQTDMKYMFNENSCFVKMIEYPDVYPLQVQVYSIENINLPVESVRLNLTFEEL